MLKYSLIKAIAPFALLSTARAADVADSPTPGRSLSGNELSASIPDLMEQTYEYGLTISEIIEQTKKRLQRIESIWGEIPMPQAISASKFVEDVYRIIQALTDHLQEINRLARNPQRADFFQLKSKINQKIEIPDFGSSSMGWKSNRWALTPDGWFPILDAFLRRAEFKIMHSADLEELKALYH